VANKIKDLKSAFSNLEKALQIAESENDIAMVSELKYIEIPAVRKGLSENQKRLVKLQSRRMINNQEVSKE